MRKLLSIAATLALAGAFAVAQDQSSSQTSNNPDQNAAQSQTATPDQNANPSAATPDQNANPSSTATPDQNANPSSSAAGTNANANTNANGKKLPQTASPLPLLGLLGAGSLAAGLASRRKK
jgi:hypothetical protein